MILKSPEEHQLPQIHSFIKSEAPHFRTSLERFLKSDSVDNPKANNLSRVITKEGRVIAYMCLRDHSLAPSKMRVFKFWICECPEREQIANEFLELSNDNYSQEVISSAIFEDETWKLNFLKKSRYIEKGQMWKSNINPQNYRGHEQVITLPENIRIVSGREMYSTCDSALEKFYELEKNIVDIIPAEFPMEPMSFEDFKKHKENSGFSLDLSFFAVKDNTPIGLSSIMIVEDHVEVMLTGVEKEFQGLGIAYGLKERAILACKKEGYDYLSTMNDSVNTPMLSLNSKFSFQKEIAIVRLDRENSSL